ncbi:MAG TPA: histidine phosphatase family protein [Anaerolineaceae bacterium]|nr:histidine phosphatase family protein [Anaerolineaceae bacterium]
MNTVYIIRHGENHANLIKQLSSKLVDYPLTEKGILQAQQTGEALAGRGIEALFCSPLKRAKQTAEIVGTYIGLVPTVLDELIEIDVGEMEKVRSTYEIWQAHDAIIERWQHGEPDARFPGGDDYHSLLGRTRAGLLKVIHGRTNSAVALVGHFGMFNFTLNDICQNVSGHMLKREENHNCSITTMEAEAVDGMLFASLVDWANADHLHGEAAKLVPARPVPEDFHGLNE